MITASDARELCGLTQLVEAQINCQIKAAAKAGKSSVVLSFNSDAVAKQAKTKLEANGFVCIAISNRFVSVEWEVVV